jgi:nitrite reductase (NADH) small subunit
MSPPAASSPSPVWHPLCSAAECPPGSSRELVVDDRVVALFCVDGRFFALDGICPHQGGPLGKGCLSGYRVTCPWHGWQFDVRTGEHLTSAAVRQPALPVKVEGDMILVQLPEAP